MNEEIELVLKLAKMEKENQMVIDHIQELERALLAAMDIEALGLARCLENELITAKTALSKSAIYNAQLNQMLRAKYGE